MHKIVYILLILVVYAKKNAQVSVMICLSNDVANTQVKGDTISFRGNGYFQSSVCQTLTL